MYEICNWHKKLESQPIKWEAFIQNFSNFDLKLHLIDNSDARGSMKAYLMLFEKQQRQTLTQLMRYEQSNFS